MKSFLAVSLLLSAALADAAVLPGFRLEKIADTKGFVTSLASDSKGNLYYTVTAGGIYRAGGERVASVTTTGTGNSGLLGMAMLDDETAVVHYTTPNQTHDVVALIDLPSGTERMLHRFACDIESPERGSSSEHHGGNPSVAPDGSIFVGIGDYGASLLATFEEWNAGKVFRIATDGNVERFATGLRNPFDLVYDSTRDRLILSDNGPTGGDELHIVQEGSNCGWPYTSGTTQAFLGTVAPVFVFDTTVAPTGMALLSGANPNLRRGLLLGSFVTKSLYWFPDLEARPFVKPVAILAGDVGFVIDVAQDATGNIYVASSNAIYRLVPPRRGDCNGDGALDGDDLDAFASELADGVSQPSWSAHLGSHKGSLGCDADGDDRITAADGVEMAKLVGWRRRSVQR